MDVTRRRYLQAAVLFDELKNRLAERMLNAALHHKLDGTAEQEAGNLPDRYGNKQ